MISEEETLIKDLTEFDKLLREACVKMVRKDPSILDKPKSSLSAHPPRCPRIPSVTGVVEL